jgi:hypothetical protein
MAEYHLPNKLNYDVSSKFEVWFRRLKNSVYGEWIPLGNILDCTMTPTIEKLTVKSNLYGLDAVDREITISRALTTKLTVNELVRENLEMLLGTSARRASQTMSVPLHVKQAFVASSLTLADAPIVSIISIKPLSGEDAFVEGATADYECNESTGVITLPVGSQIGATEEVWVRYLKSKTVTTYAIMDDLAFEGQLFLIKNGLNAGPQRYTYLPSVKVVPDGDFPQNTKSEETKASLIFTSQEDPTDGFGRQGVL